MIMPLCGQLQELKKLIHFNIYVSVLQLSVRVLVQGKIAVKKD